MTERMSLIDFLPAQEAPSSPPGRVKSLPPAQAPPGTCECVVPAVVGVDLPPVVGEGLQPVLVLVRAVRLLVLEGDPSIRSGPWMRLPGGGSFLFQEQSCLLPAILRPNRWSWVRPCQEVTGHTPCLQGPVARTEPMQLPDVHPQPQRPRGRDLPSAGHPWTPQLVLGQVYGKNHPFPEALALASPMDFAASTQCDLNAKFGTKPRLGRPQAHFSTGDLRKVVTQLDLPGLWKDPGGQSWKTPIWHRLL